MKPGLEPDSGRSHLRSAPSSFSGYLPHSVSAHWLFMLWFGHIASAVSEGTKVGLMAISRNASNKLRHARGGSQPLSGASTAQCLHIGSIHLKMAEPLRDKITLTICFTVELHNVKKNTPKKQLWEDIGSIWSVTELNAIFLYHCKIKYKHFLLDVDKIEGEKKVWEFVSHLCGKKVDFSQLNYKKKMFRA